MKSSYFLIVLLFFIGFSDISAQLDFPMPLKDISFYAEENDDDDDEATQSIEYNPENAYCFKFTWMGPQYDNTTKFDNYTCSEFLDATKLADVPCRPPLVISNDGTSPNMAYLFEKHKEKVLCKRSSGKTCVKYSLLYDNALQLVTYMCAKVLSFDEEGTQEGAIRSGCYSSGDTTGNKVEACMCESGSGKSMPCNSATQYVVASTVLTISLISLRLLS